MDVAEADGRGVLMWMSRIEALVAVDHAALQLFDHTLSHVFGQRFAVPSHLILSP